MEEGSWKGVKGIKLREINKKLENNKGDWERGKGVSKKKEKHILLGEKKRDRNPLLNYVGG